MARHKNKLFNMRLPEKLLKEYMDFCEEFKISASWRLRTYMEKDILAWRKAKLEKKNKLNDEKKLGE